MPCNHPLQHLAPQPFRHLPLPFLDSLRPHPSTSSNTTNQLHHRVKCQEHTLDRSPGDPCLVHGAQQGLLARNELARGDDLEHVRVSEEWGRGSWATASEEGGDSSSGRVVDWGVRGGHDEL
ncbi:hypothetical protein BCR44DRAFT_42976 [Catenaria anguillulae PL171]|uniref:Uncharacterized protein n=1 Tax=Catenaria anguillulae PL171 TaxID=765915 RepID=A0A1Y2HGV2_9FUNG|nr:hypothetical protein BCR44DRAFT_42976 [Catenaria anguillulae PL171]